VATKEIPIPLLACIPDTTNPPAYVANGGRPYLGFDSSTDELVYVGFVLPGDYVGTPTVEFEWSGTASTTTSDDVTWAVEVMASTGDTDGSPVSDSYDTANTVNDAILGTTAGRHQSASCSLTNADSMAAGDAIWLKIYRDVSADDLAEDARLWGLSFTYSDA